LRGSSRPASLVAQSSQLSAVTTHISITSCWIRCSIGAFLAELARRQVNAVFHYVPLHTSPAGARFGRAHGELPVTDSASERLVRLPLWAGMAEREVEQVIEAVFAGVGVRARRLQPTSPVI
jgi:dTDP-4-amino-4,6-dideoxygalactose transaminase